MRAIPLAPGFAGVLASAISYMKQARSKLEHARMVALAAIGFCCFAGCGKSGKSPEEIRFGPAMNAARISAGIPPLLANWEKYEQIKHYIIWRNPRFTDGSTEGRAVHARKETTWNSQGVIITESDLYYSGKTFEHLDGTEFESCTLTYDFRKVSKGEDPWKCEIDDDARTGQCDPKRGFALLKKWGIDRSKN